MNKRRLHDFPPLLHVRRVHIQPILTHAIPNVSAAIRRGPGKKLHLVVLPDGLYTELDLA